MPEPRVLFATAAAELKPLPASIGEHSHGRSWQRENEQRVAGLWLSKLRGEFRWNHA
jgi:hypothetical protein